MLARCFTTLAFLAACHSSTPATTPPTPNAGSADPAANSAEPTAAAPAPAISEKCGANDACAEGATCVSYYGIAGPQGPQFKSCEIKCDSDAKCPTGRKCVTVADGPGRVCR